MTCKRCANEDSNHQVSKLSRSDRVIAQTTETINCPVAIDLNPVESILSNREVVTKTVILGNNGVGLREDLEADEAEARQSRRAE